MHSRAHLLVGAVLLAVAGCGGKVATGQVSYSVSATQNYAKGLKSLQDKDWVAGAKYFAFIKARFPYSKYAVLSELRLADAEFGAGNYLQAADGYKQFIKFHPTHAMVTNGYARFRIGAAYFKMLPDDFWLLPPSWEKDQSATADASRELTNFMEKYKDSPFVPKAKKMVLEVKRRLAQHEWYVATFYWQRKKPMGTVLRLRRLLDRYAGTNYDPDALWLLGQAYVKVGMNKRARATWQKLVEQHPKTKQAGQARAALRNLSS